MGDWGLSCAPSLNYNPLNATVHGATVILIAAKDLVCKCDAAEILRCAQDDKCFNGPKTVTR
jgi:hypothetical protein